MPSNQKNSISNPNRGTEDESDESSQASGEEGRDRGGRRGGAGRRSFSCMGGSDDGEDSDDHRHENDQGSI
ncbi:LOW QUALITY PROTEIN: hypothetical protein TorRG33x02_180580 [Trema orientale]|uniref:Uncharacterized protein n=1 Tax=Trema orientale TaxID=63057 RepID=A0A2P5EKX0_TREOI|nr:LOW QUALITY PROTEIN: hypothetical protein TorRG33x02_180580 [Trema orientale]